VSSFPYAEGESEKHRAAEALREATCLDSELLRESAAFATVAEKFFMVANNP
jgi:hypothetical protein